MNGVGYQVMWVMQVGDGFGGYNLPNLAWRFPDRLTVLDYV